MAAKTKQTLITLTGGTIFTPSGDDRYCDACGRNFGQDHKGFKFSTDTHGMFVNGEYSAEYLCIPCAKREGHIRSVLS